jgi:hypothetical protein
MKYLKTFEAKENGEYWRINCTSITHISVALKKLGLTPEDQTYYDIIKNEDNFVKYQFTHFYISKGITSMNEIFWDYSIDVNSFKGKYKYNGIIKVEDWEVDADKYNL